jgi:hypothetical protein
MISTDVRYMTPIMYDVLLNAEVLALQRDRSIIGTLLTSNAAGCAAGSSGVCQIWTRNLADGSVAVLFVNLAASHKGPTQTFGISLTALFPNAIKNTIATPRDLWKHEETESIKVDGGSLGVFNLEPTACKLFRVSIRPPY